MKKVLVLKKKEWKAIIESMRIPVAHLAIFEQLDSTYYSASNMYAQ